MESYTIAAKDVKVIIRVGEYRLIVSGTHICTIKHNWEWLRILEGMCLEAVAKGRQAVVAFNEGTRTSN
jgi:hypothetical protein